MSARRLVVLVGGFLTLALAVAVLLWDWSPAWSLVALVVSAGLASVLPKDG